jgi:hypothetical protein
VLASSGGDFSKKISGNSKKNKKNKIRLIFSMREERQQVEPKRTPKIPIFGVIKMVCQKIYRDFQDNPAFYLSSTGIFRALPGYKELIDFFIFLWHYI